ncbi:unnamed protein product [Sphagnum troendelagicum]|uniref:HAT C-terminal dimerisation domain-containing protein n=1 Tax=Sphagnum troendelagicum TaxID=128251 RepID=A0ABP0UMY4_9BRYO
MNVKCPKKTYRWVNLGVLLNFLKQYRRTIVQHVTAKASNKLSSDQWWVIAYAIAPAIEEINKTFVMSQSRSLLIAFQESFIQTFIGILVAMFGIVHGAPTTLTMTPTGSRCSSSGALSGPSSSSTSRTKARSPSHATSAWTRQFKMYNEDAVPQQARVERLRALFDGLATTLANTIAVESNFSILKWEMDEFRTDLMHLSLEGIFQTK